MKEQIVSYVIGIITGALSLMVLAEIMEAVIERREQGNDRKPLMGFGHREEDDETIVLGFR